MQPDQAMLSRSDLAEIARELELLRGTHTMLEDAAVDRERIAHLERLVASATIVDDAFPDDGLATLGSFVVVRDRADRPIEYEIVGWRPAGSLPTQVTPASPIGKALLGARRGDVVRVVLPNGRERTLEVLAVRQGSIRPRRMA